MTAMNFAFTLPLALILILIISQKFASMATAHIPNPVKRFEAWDSLFVRVAMRLLGVVCLFYFPLIVAFSQIDACDAREKSYAKPLNTVLCDKETNVCLPN